MISLRVSILVGLTASLGMANLPEDPVEYAAWEAKRLATVAEVSDWPPEKAIPELGKWVHKLSMNHNLEKGDRPVFTAARTALMAIPGYAEWHGERIKKCTESKIPGSKSAAEWVGKYSTHQRRWDYQTLEQLPGPETVKVLGELLFDERDPWKEIYWGDGGRPMPNSRNAAKTLHGLGIKDPPVNSKYFNNGDIGTWQLWIEQVRSGKRTFSFEGDEATYDLEGPVRTNPPKNRRVRGSDDAVYDTGLTHEENDETTTRLPLILALVLVAIAGMYVIVVSKKRSAS